MRQGPTAIMLEIRRLREARGLSQEDAARLVGVAVKTYWRWESMAEPSLERLREIAAAFNAELVVELRSL